jgi:hypothetical protein
MDWFLYLGVAPLKYHEPEGRIILFAGFVIDLDFLYRFTETSYS